MDRRWTATLCRFHECAFLFPPLWEPMDRHWTATLRGFRECALFFPPLVKGRLASIPLNQQQSNSVDVCILSSTVVGEGEAPSEPAEAIAAQQELRPPENARPHADWEGEAPSEPAEAIAAQQELRPPENARPHANWEGEAPSEPDNATACREAAVPESCKGI